jgi:hypothetical protein
MSKIKQQLWQCTLIKVIWIWSLLQNNLLSYTHPFCEKGDDMMPTWWGEWCQHCDTALSVT